VERLGDLRKPRKGFVQGWGEREATREGSVRKKKGRIPSIVVGRDKIGLSSVAEKDLPGFSKGKRAFLSD